MLVKGATGIGSYDNLNETIGTVYFTWIDGIDPDNPKIYTDPYKHVHIQKWVWLFNG